MLFVCVRVYKCVYVCLYVWSKDMYGVSVHVFSYVRASAARDREAGRTNVVDLEFFVTLASVASVCPIGSVSGGGGDGGDGCGVESMK